MKNKFLLLITLLMLINCGGGSYTLNQEYRNKKYDNQEIYVLSVSPKMLQHRKGKKDIYENQIGWKTTVANIITNETCSTLSKEESIKTPFGYSLCASFPISVP